MPVLVEALFFPEIDLARDQQVWYNNTSPDFINKKQNFAAQQIMLTADNKVSYLKFNDRNRQ